MQPAAALCHRADQQTTPGHSYPCHEFAHYAPRNAQRAYGHGSPTSPATVGTNLYTYRPHV